MNEYVPKTYLITASVGRPAPPSDVAELAVMACNQGLPLVRRGLRMNEQFVPHVWWDGQRTCISLFLLTFNDDAKRYEDASAHYAVDEKTEQLHLIEGRKANKAIRLNNQRHPRNLGQLVAAFKHFADFYAPKEEAA